MLKQKLQDEQISALKSKNTVKLEVLRYILAQIKNKEIEKRADLTDEEVIDVFKKVAKELRESIEAFEKGARPDLVEGSKKQLEIVETYLPAEMSDEDLKKAVAEVVEKNKALYEQNSKAVIGVCMKELRSKADPSRIMNILKTEYNV